MFVVQAWVKLYCPGWKVLWCRLVFCTSVSSNTRRLTTSTPRSMFSGTLLWRRLLFSSTLRMMPCAITRAWRRWWSSGGAVAKPRRARSGRSLFMQVICAHTLRIICPRWSTLCSLSTWCLWRPKCKFWRPSPVSFIIQVPDFTVTLTFLCSLFKFYLQNLTVSQTSSVCWNIYVAKWNTFQPKIHTQSRKRIGALFEDCSTGVLGTCNTS